VQPVSYITGRLPMAWLLRSPNATAQPSTLRLPANDHHHHMPRRQNKKAAWYDSHEEKVTKAIKELRENPDSKLKLVAAYHGFNSKTLFNRCCGRTQAARDAHPESRKLVPEEEQAVVEWAEK
jgi:hypothetical protein